VNFLLPGFLSPQLFRAVMVLVAALRLLAV
jgi:hypothetical protein